MKGQSSRGCQNITVFRMKNPPLSRKMIAVPVAWIPELFTPLSRNLMAPNVLCSGIQFLVDTSGIFNEIFGMTFFK